VPTFLSDEWFGRVRELKDQVGPFDVPAPYQGLTINLQIAKPDGSTQAVSLANGSFAPGATDGAPVTVSLPADVAKKVFVEGDAQAGAQAFVSGQMRIEGDVARLAALQHAQPNDKLRELLDGIKLATD